MAKKEHQVKSEKSCCKKEFAKKSKKDSEPKDSTALPKKHDCGGSCEDGSCHCIHISAVSTITIPVLLKNDLIFQQFKKLVFSSVFANPSSGFYYIWLPPNIG